ncbi:tetratricopeptide repeat protein [Tateyamaria omphalii]|uniref:tetratricopeptide repeat protein n=1 Tax=Tateyamaria omphalii TaxID=299262 RepID=UPI0016776FF8|nr:tetratricopeptide repeat protein [Tateyamaria omphalii]
MTHMRAFLKHLSIATSLVLLGGTASFGQTAPTIEDIETAWAKGDLQSVRAALTERIKTDDSALTAMRLGRMLVEGLGGPIDRDTGLQLLTYAAENHHLPAITLMARVYLTAGETRDPKRAAGLLRNAATRGDAEAKYYLGLLYKDGVGVEQDTEKAFSWMLGAGEGGHGPAQFELSRFYANGVGTAPDTQAARHWLNEAAASAVPEAQFAKGNELLSDPDAKATAAIEMLASAAERGFAPAQSTLGTLYLTGVPGQPVDAERAERWLRAAAMAGNLSAINNLGSAYLSGAVLNQDIPTAITLLERASDAGLARATFTLAQVYDKGAGVAPESQKAMRLYRIAVDQGSTPARIHLGELVLSGDFPGSLAPHTAVPWVMALAETDERADAIIWMEEHASKGIRPAQAALGAWYLEQPEKGERAMALLEAAAAAGHVPSQFKLGIALTNGAGIGVIDYVLAHKWLNIAATSGHADAIKTRAAVTDLMTAEQIADAHSRTRAFFDDVRAAPLPLK